MQTFLMKMNLIVLELIIANAIELMLPHSNYESEVDIQNSFVQWCYRLATVAKFVEVLL